MLINDTAVPNKRELGFFRPSQSVVAMCAAESVLGNAVPVSEDDRFLDEAAMCSAAVVGN